MDPADTGRMVALMGDAELDEGNIYECLIEAGQARHPQLLVDRRL
jgi:pyruvate dehydrogenase complex dehydrogenase (E1) component